MVAEGREEVLGLVGALDQFGAVEFSVVESIDLGLDGTIDDQVGKDGARIGVKRPPLIATADHFAGRHTSHHRTGTVPVDDPVLAIDHDRRHRIAIEYPRQ